VGEGERIKGIEAENAEYVKINIRLLKELAASEKARKDAEDKPLPPSGNSLGFGRVG